MQSCSYKDEIQQHKVWRRREQDPLYPYTSKKVDCCCKIERKVGAYMHGTRKPRELWTRYAGLTFGTWAALSCSLRTWCVLGAKKRM